MHIRLQSRRGRSLAQTSLSSFTRVPVSTPCCCCLVLGLEFTSGSCRERDRWLLSHSSCLRTIHCRNPRPCNHIEAPDGRQTPSETLTWTGLGRITGRGCEACTSPTARSLACHKGVRRPAPRPALYVCLTCLTHVCFVYGAEDGAAGTAAWVLDARRQPLIRSDAKPPSPRVPAPALAGLASSINAPGSASADACGRACKRVRERAPRVWT